MKKLSLLLFIIFSLQIAIAQDFEMIHHQVKLGETVRMISKKYKIEPAEIYRLNKFAIDGISQGQVLQLLVPKKEPAVETVQSQDDASVVQAGSSNDDSVDISTTTKTVTTTSIRKKKTTENEPVSEPAATESMEGNLGDTGSAVTHTVSSGETLSGIAKQYGISITDIKSANSKVLKRGLQPGQVLAIIKPTGIETVVDDVQVDQSGTTTGSGSQTEVKHKVQKGDTLFQLAKQYNVSVDDIKAQNEVLLKKGLQPGQVLTIATTN